jgi:hypothetical protein
MQTVSVVFDEVLHVHRLRASRTAPARTVFSFMANFDYTPYVTVPGHPRLEPGMKVLALLREPGDWKSLVGWRDTQTGEVAAPSPRWRLYRMIFLCGWLAVTMTIVGLGALRLEALQLPFSLLFAGLWAVLSYLEYKAWRRAQADLDAVKRLSALNVA